MMRVRRFWNSGALINPKSRALAKPASGANRRPVMMRAVKRVRMLLSSLNMILSSISSHVDIGVMPVGPVSA
jgi:hypothetical protein